jgi:hypothetical protein
VADGDTVVVRLVVDANSARQDLASYSADMTKAGDKTTQSMRSMAKSIEDIQARSDPIFKAQVAQQRAVEQATTRAANAVKYFGVSQSDANAIVARTNAFYGDQVTKLRAAAESNTVFGKALSGVSGQLVALSFSAGPIGVFLASIPGWGLPAAIALGGVEKAFSFTTEAADKLAGKAQQLNSFAIVTGLTADQIQVLQETAAHFGLTTQDVTTFVDHFAAQITTLHDATGPLYDMYLKINPALARQSVTAKGAAAELEILSAVYKKAGDNAAALLKLAGGRAGMADAPLIVSIGNAGSIDALGSSLNKTSFLTDQETKALQKLKAENDSLAEHIRDNIADIFSNAVLSNQIEARKEMAELTGWMKNFSISDAWSKFVEGTKEVADSLGRGLTGAHRSDLMPGGVPVIPVERGPLPPAQAMKADPQAIANQYRALIATLGDAATITDKYKAKLAEIDAAHASNKFFINGASEAEAKALEVRVRAAASLDYETQKMSIRNAAAGVAIAVVVLLAAKIAAVAADNDNREKESGVDRNKHCRAA